MNIIISGLTSDQNIGHKRFEVSSERPEERRIEPRTLRQIISATPFYSIPLHFNNELNYAFPALAPVLRALNKRSIDDNWGKIILILH